MSKLRQKRLPKSSKGRHWPLKAMVLTFGLAMGISVVSEILMRRVSLPIAIFILLVLVLIGIVFDVIAVASTSETVGPFASMAARKIPGAKQAILLVQRADLVSSICGDVIGDVCSTISGAAGAAIAVRLIAFAPSASEMLLGVAVSSVVAAVMVGGKAFGKRIAIKKSREIVYLTGWVLSLFSAEKGEKGGVDKNVGSSKAEKNKKESKSAER